MTKRRLVLLIIAMLLIWSGLVVYALAPLAVDEYKYDVIDSGQFSDRPEQPTFEDASAARERTVFFCEEEYTGNYSHSYSDVKEGGEIDEYSFDDGVFQILRSTGKLLYFRRESDTPLEERTHANAVSCEMLKRKCEMLSRELLSEYVELSDYVYEPDEFYYVYRTMLPISRMTGYYYLNYYRHIDGVKTNELVSVFFNMAGEPRGIDVRTIFTEKEISLRLDVQRLIRSMPKGYESRSDRWISKFVNKENLTLFKRWDGELLLKCGADYIILREQRDD